MAKRNPGISGDADAPLDEETLASIREHMKGRRAICVKAHASVARNVVGGITTARRQNPEKARFPGFALLEYARDRVPLRWAMIQNNLGYALLRLSERESGTARLDEAVSACRDALLEYTRDRVPLDWAMTQKNLDSALRLHEERRQSPDET
jgi:hypothetical protein